MNQEVKTKWLEVLESGAYPKAVGCLQTIKGEYCCLGVLTDLYIKETGQGHWEDAGDTRVFNGEEELLLPVEVQEWAELDSNDPYIRYEDTDFDSLSELNDDSVTFEEVIVVIREQL